jgi:hypothetical protein
MSVADDMDGDGIADADDNCPAVHNPIRPVDNGVQGDVDQDNVGDACDPCPLDANTTNCTAFDPNDPDGDGVGVGDNCPGIANADQADADDDGKGDVCDPCPMAANPGTAGCPVSIADVKTDGDLQEQRVSVADVVVTAIAPIGFFIQDNEVTPDAYSGVAVYTGSPPDDLVVGDVINIDGATVTDFFGQIQLSTASWTKLQMTMAIPPVTLDAAGVTTMIADGASSEYEGMLIEVNDIAVTDNMPEAGPGDDASNELELAGGLRLDDGIYGTPFIEPFPPNGEVFSSIVGPVSWRNGYLKILPRDINDIVFADAALAALEPTASYLRVGDDGASFPTAMFVRLNRPSGTAITVELASDNMGAVTVTSPITIDAGQLTSAPLQLQGVGAGSATITANILGDVDTVVGSVTVLANDALPDVAAIDPAEVTVNVGATQSFTVTLTHPAPASGETPLTVTITTPGGLGTAPATVDAPADALSFTFDLTAAGTAFGPANLDVTATSTVSSAVTISAAPGELIINEVDYDQPGGDTAEFIELLNPGTTPVDASGYTVVLVNGNNETEYNSVSLASVGTVAAGGYVVIGPPGFDGGLPGGTAFVAFSGSQDNVQNGAPDGVALLDGATMLDALSYEGAINGYSGGSLVEGTATPAADDNATAGLSVCRLPNGEDTDDASVDWTLCSSTPGAANMAQ